MRTPIKSFIRMKKSAKLISFILSVILLFALTGISLSACSFDGSDILSVRQRADKLRGEMSAALGDAFIARDAKAVKATFCTKSQALPDITEQIENTFSFIDGKVTKYRKGGRGYESYAAEYGAVDEYEFDSKLILTADTGREYCLSFRVFYIVDDVTVKGMTAYSITELYGDGCNFCSAGCYWSMDG